MFVCILHFRTVFIKLPSNFCQRLKGIGDTFSRCEIRPYRRVERLQPRFLLLPLTMHTKNTTYPLVGIKIVSYTQVYYECTVNEYMCTYGYRTLHNAANPFGLPRANGNDIRVRRALSCGNIFVRLYVEKKCPTLVCM